MPDSEVVADACELAESCVYCRCGCCKDGCPVYEEVLEESMSPKGRNELIRAIGKEVVEPDDRAMRILYSCLLCRRDEYSCGAKLRNAEATEQFRRELVRSGVPLLPEHRLLVTNLRNYGNPWGESRSMRKRWARGLDALGKTQGKGSLDLLFVGCTYALDRSLHESPKALASVMAKAAVEYGAMLDSELCCGSTVRRIGDEALFEDVRDRSARAILDWHPRRLVTPCAGCYKTLSQDYRSKLEGLEVLHSTQYLLRLFSEGRLRFVEEEAVVTYHDPCHLGRHAGLYDEPRAVIKNLPGLRLVEMRSSRELSRCCGGGGGVKTAYPEVSARVAAKRVDEAESTGASMLVTACPFCMQSLSAAAAAAGAGIEVVDLSVLVDRRTLSRGEA